MAHLKWPFKCTTFPSFNSTYQICSTSYCHSRASLAAILSLSIFFFKHQGPDCITRAQKNHLPGRGNVTIMDQASIASPEVTSGPGYGVTFTTYLHSISWVLRKAISLRTGTGNLFDKTLLVSTPSLGEGHVRISICVPKTHNNDSAPKKMVLVAEGGGFVLGQPTDGEHIDRQLSDRVSLVNQSIVIQCVK